MSLTDLLIRHEDLKLKPYLDSAKPPRLTIGVGRNLDDRGITKAEALYLLENDIRTASEDLLAVIGEGAVHALNEARHAALVSMCFNLGRARFAKFKATIAAVKAQDWERAADQMLKSLWARQVGDRADELARMVRTGEFKPA